MLKEYEALVTKYTALYGSSTETVAEAAEADGFEVYKLHRMSNIITMRAHKKTEDTLIELCLVFDRKADDTLSDVNINMIKD